MGKCVCVCVSTYREDMNEIEVSVLVVKATYKVNHLYGMLQNICLHDSKQLNAMLQPIAIEFRRICLANPTAQLSQTHNQSTAKSVRNENKYKNNIFYNFF